MIDLSTPTLHSICTRPTTIKAMSLRGWVTKYTCCVCRQNRSSNEQAMLVCASCMKAWHSRTFSLSLGTQGSLAHRGVWDMSGIACHTPPVTQKELTKMWKAETDKNALPHVRRLSTWRCMRCSLPFSVQSKGNIFVSVIESHFLYTVR